MAALALLFYMFLNVGEFDPGLYRGGFLLAAMVSALLIAATVHPASKLVPWLLGFAVFRWIGVRSYGIYLWHWPIYMVTRPHSDVPITGLPLLAIRLTLTFAAAAVSYRYVEEPIRHGAIERRWAQYRTATGETRRQLAARATVATVAIAAGLAIVVIGLGNGGSAGTPEGFPNLSWSMSPDSSRSIPRRPWRKPSRSSNRGFNTWKRHSGREGNPSGNPTSPKWKHSGRRPRRWINLKEGGLK